MTTALRNRDVLQIDLTQSIPNDGVSKVAKPSSPEEWAVLKYELQSFVSKGEYALGLERILSSFLRHLDQPSQPAAWVSGFFGSGKSHFVRVLHALWANTVFPDGATARSLVPDLPSEIEAQLLELSTRGRQYGGGLWAASGQFSQGITSPRLALLALLFQNEGLPSEYGPARFMLWLRQNGYLADVREALARSNRSLEGELPHLLVSPFLGAALVEAVPGFAPDAASALAALRSQFGPVPDISEEQMFATARNLLTQVSADQTSLPLSLIVLDELQQYIGDESSRTLQVQQIVEACSSQFGSRLLFVATGQSALRETPQLQKLQGRFSVKVQLSENDVREVVQRVVLQKRSDRLPVLTETLDRVSQEIDRQMQDSNIGANAADRPHQVALYPVLPARMRFWEAVLRAVDKEGTNAQLRSQLKVIHDAAAGVADRPLGWVIPGDAIFESMRSELLNSGVLPTSINRAIADLLNSDDADARLRGRLLALIFLINELPREGIRLPGVKSTPATLADLVVEDLETGSTALREEVSAVLSAMANEGMLLDANGEYHIQTPESQEWEADYRGRLTRVKNDSARLESDRNNAFRAAFSTSFSKAISVTQGKSKIKRAWQPHFGNEEPNIGTTLNVWVRDEWSSTLSTVRTDAQQAGTSSPMVFMFLSRRNADELRNALASYAAASETYASRPIPSSDDGRNARAAMNSRVEAEKAKLDGLVQGILDQARILQGGGNEIEEGSPTASLQRALDDAAVRKYPKFDLGDDPNWEKVVKRANEGRGDPLTGIGYTGEVTADPVCAAELSWLDQPRTGAQIRAHFEGEPFGWPQDTIHGALLALVADGQVEAKSQNKQKTPKDLIHGQIGQTEFKRVLNPLNVTERLTLADTLKKTIGASSTADLAGSLPVLLKKLLELANQAGGDAPLPARPNTELVDELLSAQGVAQLRGAYDQHNELQDLFQHWSALAVRRPERLTNWRRLGDLLKHARQLTAADDARSQFEAILTNRSLLIDPDPVTPLLTEVNDLLRAALNERYAAFVDRRKELIDGLQQTPEWKQLGDDQWHPILAGKDLLSPAPLELGSEAQILAELERFSLSAWEERIAALPVRVQMAHEEAARILVPTAKRVLIKSATLSSAAEVDTWLAELKSRMDAAIDAGQPVLIQGS